MEFISTVLEKSRSSCYHLHLEKLVDEPLFRNLKMQVRHKPYAFLVSEKRLVFFAWNYFMEEEK